MTTILTAVIFIIAVIGFGLIFKNMKTKQSSGNAQQVPGSGSQASSSQKSSPAPEQEYKAIMDSLLRLNIFLRKDRDISKELQSQIEAIIDDLIAITPAMMERYPGETLTYEIKKIGKEHLFKTVKEYLDLSIESRANQFDMFTRTIDNLHDVSKRSRDIVEKNETAEFKTMANFLAGKFS